MNLHIEIFSSPGCSKCGHGKIMLGKIADEIGKGRISWQEVNILERMDYAIELGVLSTPAIAIDGKLVFVGLPSEKKLRKELEKRLSGA